MVLIARVIVTLVMLASCAIVSWKILNEVVIRTLAEFRGLFIDLEPTGK